MKIIPLTKGRYAIVDDEDAYFLIQWPWQHSGEEGRGPGYATRTAWINKKRVKLKIEHQILGVPPKGYVWDHVNRNSLDNRRANLRLATVKDNTRNRSRPKKARARFIGVYWEKASKKYRAMIGWNKKLIHLGRFSTEIAAARARDAKARQLHGQFAVLNFPD